LDHVPDGVMEEIARRQDSHDILYTEERAF